LRHDRDLARVREIHLQRRDRHDPALERMEIRSRPRFPRATGGPIQYTFSPRGFLLATTGCALCRRPSRVTSMPRSSSYGTSGTFTLSSTGAPNGALANRATRSCAMRAAVL